MSWKSCWEEAGGRLVDGAALRAGGHAPAGAKRTSGHPRASLHTQPADIVQASLEAVAYRFAVIYGRILPNLPGRTKSSPAAGCSAPRMDADLADVLGEPLLTLGEGSHQQRASAPPWNNSASSTSRPTAAPYRTSIRARPVAPRLIPCGGADKPSSMKRLLLNS